MTINAFTISRDEWLRGEHETKSFLLRPEDRQMCCIGIYLRACGFVDDELAAQQAPNEFTPFQRARVPSWLLDKDSKGIESQSTRDLMHVNDFMEDYLHDDLYDEPKERFQNILGEEIVLEQLEEQRERAIAKLFAAQGITVTFTD